MNHHKRLGRCLLTLAAAALAVQAQDIGGFGPAVAPGAESSDLAAQRQLRDALITAADFVAALPPAEQSLALAEAEADADSANDLVQLARVQAELGELDDAEVNYLAAIEQLEERDGADSTSLIPAYQGLGRSYIDSRRFEEAITVLEHARDLSQRSTGLFNVSQTQLLDDITMAWLGRGNTFEARDLQEQRLENAVRAFGEDDPRVAPFYRHLAEYYDNSRLRLSARENYEKELSVYEALPGSDSAVAQSLRSLVRIELLLGDDDQAKQRLEALLAESEDINLIERGLALATLGDWAMVEEDYMTAGLRYGEAYAALKAANPVQADEFFAAPVMIDFIPPLSPVDRGRRSDPYAWGNLLLKFDVNAEGRATDVETVELEPAGDADVAYNRRIRETHFRPRLADGVPVATTGVEFSHYFRYYVRTRRRDR